MTYLAVDCQGFAGGFTLGMVQAGFTLIGKREMRGGFGVANCEANRHLLGEHWHAESVDPAQWTAPAAHVVFGNPPCSGFSVMSAKSFRGAGSKINHCMWAFAEYAARVRPLVAVFESVQIARTSPDGLELMRALRAKVEALTDERWTLYHVRHNALHLGGAAERRRYFWLISRIPFGVEPHEQRAWPLFSEVIEDLTNLDQRWESQPYRDPPSWWAESRVSSSGEVDGHIGLDNPLTRRLQDLMRGVEWPPGAHIGAVARLHYEKHGKLPASWKGTEQKIVTNDFFMGYTTPVRWHGDRAGRVITGGGLHNVIHPTLNRTITHRETARVLGFPDDWKILPLRGLPGLNMTWGKGITVDCGRWIGKWIRAALDGAPGSYVGTPIGEREFDINLTHGLRSIVSRSPGIVTRVKQSHTTQSPSRRSSTVTNETTEQPTGRGRPRPAATIERDAKVLEFIESAGNTGVTRAEIAAKLELPGTEAYLSVYRLSRGDAKIKKIGNRWVDVKAEAPAPETSVPATEAPTVPEFTG